MTSFYSTVCLFDTSIFPVRSDPLANCSIHSKCGIKRLEQSCIAEWLVQALHRALFKHSRTEVLVSMSGNEHDRNLFPAKLQFLLEVDPRHSWHGDVENQASGLADKIGREELFRRRE